MLDKRAEGIVVIVPSSWRDLMHQGHLGLLGATERAATIGAHLEIISAPGRGTTIRVTVCLPEETERGSNDAQYFGLRSCRAGR